MPNGNIELSKTLDFTGSILEPLTPFKDKLIVLKGLDLSVHNQPPGEPHQQGMAFLTGPRAQQGQPGRRRRHAGGMGQRHLGRSGNRQRHRQGLPAQVAALWRAVDGLRRHRGPDRHQLHRLRPADRQRDQPVQHVQSPSSRSSEQIRSGSRSSAFAATRFSMLSESSTPRSPRVSAKRTRQKLEQHLAAVRDVEMRLDNKSGALGGSCQLPDDGRPINLNDPNNYPAHRKAPDRSPGDGARAAISRASPRCSGRRRRTTSRIRT